MNLIERRRQMMMSKSLPYDAEIEYLQGNTNAYVDTLVNASSLVAVEGEFSICNAQNNIWIFGGRIMLHNNQIGLLYRYNLTKNYLWRRSISNAEQQFYEALLDVNSFSNNGNSLNTMVVNNTAHTITDSNFNANTSIYLFAMHNQDGTTTGESSAALKLRWVKMYESGSLVRDFIPVRVGQVGYMYDKVSGQLFGNQGTGNFVLGPDKN